MSEKYPYAKDGKELWVTATSDYGSEREVLIHHKEGDLLCCTECKEPFKDYSLDENFDDGKDWLLTCPDQGHVFHEKCRDDHIINKHCYQHEMVMDKGKMKLV